MNGTDEWGFVTSGATADTPRAPAPGTRSAPDLDARPPTGPAHEAKGATPTADSGTARRETYEPQRAARAALTRILEPGDETAGRWLRDMGPVALWHALSADDASLPAGASPTKVAGLRLRVARARPAADLAAVAALGGRFICPGDEEWPRQLDDLGDGRPIGLWVRGVAGLRLWALRSVAVVGARSCTEYGAHLATTLAAGLAERGWTVVSGAAPVLYPVTVVAGARCHPCGGVGVERPVLAAS